MHTRTHTHHEIYQFCPEFSITIFTWALDPIEITILSICNLPGDITPPDAANAFVEVQQLDAVTIGATWGGFEEPDGDIEYMVTCALSVACRGFL